MILSIWQVGIALAAAIEAGCGAACVYTVTQTVAKAAGKSLGSTQFAADVCWKMTGYCKYEPCWPPSS